MAQLYGKKTSDGLPKALECTDEGLLKVDTEISAVLDPTGLATEVTLASMSADLGIVRTDLATVKADIALMKADLATSTAARVIDHNQVVMTGSAVQLSSTPKIYKRLMLTPHPDNSGNAFAGSNGVTSTTGEFISALSTIEYINVDISTIYAIGILSDRICWRGEY